AGLLEHREEGQLTPIAPGPTVFSEKTRIIGAGAIGNVLEWFDFAIYGYFAITIGQAFFPHQDPLAQLLSTFSQLDGAGNRSGLERGFIAASRISVQVAVIGGGILWAVGPAFLKRWVPQQAAEATPVLLALILPHVLGAAQIPARHLLISMARHRPLALTFLVGITLNIALTFVLVRIYGIVGAAVASLVVMSLVYAVAMPWLVVRQVGMPWRTVAWECLWLPLGRSTLLLAPAFVMVRRWLEVPTYGHIMLGIAALSAAFFALLTLGLLGREERTWFHLGLQLLFKRNKAAARPPVASP
ncbi:MAG TPA: hypothetical protein DCP71_09245, partial [Verrucomicrobiales bacterium]|nr:hypothetical protein [Verrucomicrobiales bacterium]